MMLEVAVVVEMAKEVVPDVKAAIVMKAIEMVKETVVEMTVVVEMELGMVLMLEVVLVVMLEIVTAVVEMEEEVVMTEVVVKVCDE